MSDTWIGLSDQRSEGNWRWVGTQIHGQFFDWNPGEPNNYKNEDCVGFCINHEYRWNDFSCNDKLRPLCEK